MTSIEEIRTKIINRNELEGIAADLESTGKQAVFTNGCFDIMHAGHVSYLGAARNQGDLLVVGLNSDRSVATIKGPSRPIVAQEMRAQVLAALESVDYIVVFDALDPLQVILALKPDVLVKGADWEEDQIIGAREVKAAGGQVVRVPLVPEISTSAIIRQILKNSAALQES